MPWTNESSNNLRQYQLYLLEILDAFISVCQSQNLRYYLNAGTLLGAVRHQGFIPWDDDIDVCMPRTDYEQFLSCSAKMLPSHLRAVWFRNQKKGEHLQYYCQIQNLKVPIIQYIADLPHETYAWIDVFPLDGMPTSSFSRKLYGLYLLYRRARVQLSMFEKNVNIYKKNRPLYEKAIIFLYRITGFGRNSDTYYMMEKLDFALKCYPENTSSFWINFMGAYKLRETVPADVYGTGIPCIFENRKLMIPQNPDYILTQLYGNYMVPIKPLGVDGHRIVYREIS